MDENCHSHSIMGILLKQIFTQEDTKNQIKATRYYCCWTQLKSSAILSIFVTLPVILTTSVHRIAMSDNVPLRDQESCIDDDYYMIDVFTYARPATNGETGSLHQLVMYITRALEDSGRLDILRAYFDLTNPIWRIQQSFRIFGICSLEKEKQRDQNIMKIYSNSFRWKKTQGENIIAKLFLGGFHADEKIERKKVDHMKLAENVVFTLPVSDASKMTVEGNLLNEDGEMILEIGHMNVNLIKFQDGETRVGIEQEYSGNEAVEQDVAT